ncbi:hypothetical protein HPP92_028896 [Vanilla planifolia]|uniref:Uncharacterized protein n=1 Tax=Vanilla planifolia TaxID=51239 RepID=A0A835P985_VANPL|nr:hypothetical protein HPP92_028896 [Vanilla planifolia]KAG0446327.1 hypothetical protein HPP92_028886 [Vanilla planifolia]
MPSSADAGGEPQLETPLHNAINCLILCVGNAGGPLLLESISSTEATERWFSAWLRPPVVVLFLTLSLSYLYRRQSDPPRSGPFT